MKPRFSTFNDGVLSLCDPVDEEYSFGSPKNVRTTEEIQRLLKLTFEEKSKRDQDIEFAESMGRSLSLKVKTRYHRMIEPTKKVIIDGMLYSIIKVDHDRAKGESYLYLEEERRIK